MGSFNVFLTFMTLLTVALVTMSLLFSKSKNAKIKNGEIKRRALKNSAPPYDVGNWVDEMESFMKKPVYKELMELKGREHD